MVLEDDQVLFQYCDRVYYIASILGLGTEL